MMAGTRVLLSASLAAALGSGAWAAAAATAEVERSATAERADPRFSVCVLPFGNRDEVSACSWQGIALADLFTHSLAQVPAIRVLERQALDSIAREIELGCTGLLDSIQAAKAGRLGQMDYVIFGSFLQTGDRLHVEAHAVNTRSGALAGFIEYDADKKGLIAWIPEAAGLLLKQMTGKTDPAWSDQLRRLPTQSYTALEQFYRGLLLMDANDGLAAVQFLLQATKADRRFGRARYWAGRAYEMLGQPEHAVIQYSQLASAASLRELNGGCLGDAQEQLLAHNMTQAYAALCQAMCDQGLGDAGLVAQCVRHCGTVPARANFLNYVGDPAQVFVVGRDVVLCQEVAVFAAPPAMLIVSAARKSALTNAWEVLPLPYLLNEHNPRELPGTSTYLWQTPEGRPRDEGSNGVSRKILGQPQKSVYIPAAGLTNGDELVFGLVDEGSCGKLVVRSQPYDADIRINTWLTGSHTPGVVFLRPGGYDTDLQLVRSIRLNLAESSFGGYYKQGQSEADHIVMAGGGTVRLDKELKFQRPVVGWQDFSLPKVDSQRILWRSNRKCLARAYRGAPQMVMNVHARSTDEVYVLWSAWMQSEYADSFMETWIARCDRTFAQSSMNMVSIRGTQTILHPYLTSDGRQFILIFWDEPDRPGKPDQFKLRCATSPDAREWTAGAFVEGPARRFVLGSLVDDSPMRDSLPFTVHQKGDGRPFVILASGETLVWNGHSLERSAGVTVEVPGRAEPWDAGLLATYGSGLAVVGYPTNCFGIAREVAWPRYRLEQPLCAEIASPARCRRDASARPWYGERWRVLEGGTGGPFITDAVNVWKLADFSVAGDPLSATNQIVPVWSLPADYRTLIGAGLERMQFVLYRMDAAQATDGTFCRAIFGYYGGTANHPLGTRLFERPFVVVGYGRPGEQKR